MTDRFFSHCISHSSREGTLRSSFFPVTIVSISHQRQLVRGSVAPRVVRSECTVLLLSVYTIDFLIVKLEITQVMQLKHEKYPAYDCRA